MVGLGSGFGTGPVIGIGFDGVVVFGIVSSMLKGTWASGDVGVLMTCGIG